MSFDCLDNNSSKLCSPVINQDDKAISKILLTDGLANSLKLLEQDKPKIILSISNAQTVLKHPTELSELHVHLIMY